MRVLGCLFVRDASAYAATAWHMYAGLVCYLSRAHKQAGKQAGAVGERATKMNAAATGRRDELVRGTSPEERRVVWERQRLGIRRQQDIAELHAVGHDYIDAGDKHFRAAQRANHPVLVRVCRQLDSNVQMLRRYADVSAQQDE